MTGRCTHWDYNNGIGWVSRGAGTAMFVHASQVPEDELGRRYLLMDERIEFDIGFRKDDTRPMAVNVKLLDAREAENADEYWEEGYVESLKGPHGALIKRPAGGWAFLYKANVVTQISFQKLQLWRYRIAPPMAYGLNWLAVDAELLNE